MTDIQESMGEGRFIGLQASTTVEIPVGSILEQDSNGYVTLPTTTPGNMVIGVAATKKPSQTTASAKNIVVQTAGLAPVRVSAGEGTYNELIVAFGTTGGIGTTHSADASTLNPYKIVGRVVVPATTSGTTCVVLLRGF